MTPTPLSALPRGTRIRHDGTEWRIYGAHRGRVLLLSAGGLREVDGAVEVVVISDSPSNDRQKVQAAGIAPEVAIG